MRILFLILIITTVLYVVIKKRQFDFFSISVFSAILYFFPAIIGFVLIDGRKQYITGKVYFCLSIFVAILFIFILVEDFRFQPEVIYKLGELEKDDNYVANVSMLLLEVVGLLLCIYATYRYKGKIIGNFDKVELLETSNKYVEYLKYIALFTFVYSFTNSGKHILMLRVVAVALISFTFLLGHRSFFVIGLISIFVYVVGGNKKVSLIVEMKKHWVMFSLMIVFALFFLFVKNIFYALMNGDIDLVKSKLSDPGYYLDALLNSESNTIMVSLQSVVMDDFKYDVAQFFIGFFTLIPFIGGKIGQNLGYSPFEVLLNRRYNPVYNLGYGIGSTYLGESYAIGGYVSLVFSCLFAFCVIDIMKKYINKRKSGFTVNYFQIVSVYFSFYLYRNSLIFILTMARAYLYITLLTIIFDKILNKFYY